MAGVDRFGAVADFVRAGAAARISRRIVGGVFAARIVVGDDHVVGQRAAIGPSADACPCRGRRRSRTRRKLACGVRAQRRQHILQRVRRVGVIDIDRRAALRKATFSIRPGAPLSTASAAKPRALLAKADGEACRDQRVGRLEMRPPGAVPRRKL